MRQSSVRVHRGNSWVTGAAVTTAYFLPHERARQGWHKDTKPQITVQSAVMLYRFRVSLIQLQPIINKTS